MNEHYVNTQLTRFEKVLQTENCASQIATVKALTTYSTADHPITTCSARAAQMAQESVSATPSCATALRAALTGPTYQPTVTVQQGVSLAWLSAAYLVHL